MLTLNSFLTNAVSAWRRAQFRRAQTLLLLTFLFVVGGFGALAVRRLTAQASASPPAPAPQADEQSVSPHAWQQIQALSAEKASRTAIQRKLDSQLLYLLKQQRGEALVPAVAKLELTVQVDEAGRVPIEVIGQLSKKVLVNLEAKQVEILQTLPQYHSLRALAPLDQLEALASLPEISYVKPASALQVHPASPAAPAAENLGAVQTAITQSLNRRSTTSVSNVPPGGALFQGDVTHRADVARRNFGVNGTGVKIGVISNGVSNLRTSQALGYLGQVTVLPGQSGGGDGGTALLEVIHKIAPGAQLYFASASGLPEFAHVIRQLRAAGCDILLDNFVTAQLSPFHDGQKPDVVSTTNGGLLTQAVNDVVADGAIYIAESGVTGNRNDGLTGTWEGDFKDGGPATGPLAGFGRVHDFGTGNLYDVLAERAEPFFVTLHWADPLGGSANDYDLYVLDPTGTTVLAASTNLQDGSQDPFEMVGPQPVGRRVVIVKRSGADRFLHLGVTRSRFTNSTVGGIRSHCLSPGCYNTASTPAHTAFFNLPNAGTGPYPNPFTQANEVERLSVDGPRRIFFQADGTPYTPGNFSATGGIVRQKPDITAADGVLASGVGAYFTYPPLFLNYSPLWGTGAPCSHLAAILALLKSADPSLTNAQLREALFNSAIDIEAPGVDRDSGHGIAMAAEAAQYLGLKPAADLEIGAILAAEIRGNGNGVVEPGEIGGLTVELKNLGPVNASGIRAAFSSSSPWVQAWQPVETSYPDLPAQTGVGLNRAPLLFYVNSAAPHDLTGLFVLTVNSTGGAGEKTLPFNVSLGTAPTTIAAALGNTPNANGLNYTAATGSQTGRLVPNQTPSVCGKTKATPALVATGARRFDAYTFATVESHAPTCATVYLQRTCPTSLLGVSVVAYAGSYDPANPAANYLADLGVFTAPNLLASFSFQVPGGTPVVLVVSEADPGGAVGCGYTLTVTGLGQATLAANLIGIQDDQSGDWLVFNEMSGEYLFTNCLSGQTLSGRGAVVRHGCSLTLKDGYRLNATFQNCMFAPEEGTATVRLNPFGQTYTLRDTNRANNSCNCP